jgi:hypothetical protein
MKIFYAPIDNEDDMWVEIDLLSPPQVASIPYKNLTSFVQHNDEVLIGETVFPVTLQILVYCV